MAALSTVLLGHGALARTVVVAGALPLGAWGAYRLVRTLTGASLPAVVAATAYVVNPVGRDAIAHGELGPLVCFALAPFVLHALVPRDARRHRARANGSSASRRRRSAPSWWSGLLGAVAGSVWPPAILLAVLVAVVFVDLGAARGGRVAAILRAAGLALGCGAP